MKIKTLIVVRVFSEKQEFPNEFLFFIFSGIPRNAPVSEGFGAVFLPDRATGGSLPEMEVFA